MAWRVQNDERALVGDNLGDFLKNVPDELLSTGLYVLAAIRCIRATDRILECSAIVMTETFERDIGRLASAVGLPWNTDESASRHPRRSRSTTSNWMPA